MPNAQHAKDNAFKKITGKIKKDFLKKRIIHEITRGKTCVEISPINVSGLCNGKRIAEVEDSGDTNMTYKPIRKPLIHNEQSINNPNMDRRGVSYKTRFLRNIELNPL